MENTITITGSRVLTQTEYSWILAALDWAITGINPFSEFEFMHQIFLTVTILTENQVLIKATRFEAFIDLNKKLNTITCTVKTNE
jgi:hypothetical protein